MLVSGNKVMRPSSAKLSGTFCSAVKQSENSDKMRAATEMSLSTTSTPAGAVKVRIIGRNAQVAKRGASSVRVYMIFDFSEAMDVSSVWIDLQGP